MPNKAHKEHYKELEQVVTLAEASRLTFRDRATLRYAIDAGNLAAVQCGRVWLVSVRSLKAAFPVPEAPPQRNKHSL